ncbi:MAG: flagellar protein FliT [Betaproteobacteria bacterium]|nr:flagellar protein FliT [Betaproteobacteria bacterium]
MTILTGPEIVATYAAVWEVAIQMREAARKSEWDDLTALEGKRSGLIELLATSDMGALPTAQLNDEKADWIQKILECDTETKSLTEVWMVELRQILNSLATEAKLSDVYGSNE